MGYLVVAVPSIEAAISKHHSTTVRGMCDGMKCRESDPGFQTLRLETAFRGIGNFHCQQNLSLKEIEKKERSLSQSKAMNEKGPRLQRPFGFLLDFIRSCPVQPSEADFADLQAVSSERS